MALLCVCVLARALTPSAHKLGTFDDSSGSIKIMTVQDEDATRAACVRQSEAFIAIGSHLE